MIDEAHQYEDWMAYLRREDSDETANSTCLSACIYRMADQIDSALTTKQKTFGLDNNKFTDIAYLQYAFKQNIEYIRDNKYGMAELSLLGKHFIIARGIERNAISFSTRYLCGLEHYSRSISFRRYDEKSHLDRVASSGMFLSGDIVLQHDFSSDELLEFGNGLSLFYEVQACYDRNGQFSREKAPRAVAIYHTKDSGASKVPCNAIVLSPCGESGIVTVEVYKKGRQKKGEGVNSYGERLTFDFPSQLNMDTLPGFLKPPFEDFFPSIQHINTVTFLQHGC